jgi:CelD/BcsL family acetyltransferase involved in cellulose biosynthesis
VVNRLENSPRVGSIQGRVLKVRAISKSDEDAWRDLAGRALEPNPFFEPDCLIPAATHQSWGDEIELVVASDGDRFFACLPIRHVSRFKKLPYPIVTSQVRRMTYLGTPLVDGEYGLEAVKAILSALVEEQRKGKSRVLSLVELTDGPVAELFRSAASQLGLSLIVFESFTRGFLGRHDPPAFEVAHSPKTLRNLNRKQRNLGKELGGTVDVVDRGNDPDAFEDYIDLEASGYKADFGVAMATVPGEPEYFRAMCAGFASAGRLHLLSLTDGKRTAAMIAWVRSGDTLFQFKWSYDESFAKYSPGLILHTEAMRYFELKTDARFLDTCTWGENEMINHLYPDRRPITSFLIILGPKLRDRLVMKSMVAIRPVHRKLYELLRRERAEQALRGKRAPGAASERQPADKS